MKSKGELNVLFQRFHKMLQTQYNAQVQVICSDNGGGGEYNTADLQKYLRANGIIHQTTCSNTTQQNGEATLKKIVTCWRLFAPH